MAFPKALALGVSATLVSGTVLAFIFAIGPVAADLPCRADLIAVQGTITGGYEHVTTPTDQWNYKGSFDVYNAGTPNQNCLAAQQHAGDYAILVTVAQKVNNVIGVLGVDGLQASDDDEFGNSVANKHAYLQTLDNVPFLVENVPDPTVPGNAQANCVYVEVDTTDLIPENNDQNAGTNNNLAWWNYLALHVVASGQYTVYFGLYNSWQGGSTTFSLSHNAPAGWTITMSPSGNFAVGSRAMQGLTFTITAPSPITSYPLITFTADDLTNAGWPSLTSQVQTTS
jgi:hypothetical protein